MIENLTYHGVMNKKITIKSGFILSSLIYLANGVSWMSLRYISSNYALLWSTELLTVDKRVTLYSSEFCYKE